MTDRSELRSCPAGRPDRPCAGVIMDTGYCYRHWGYSLVALRELERQGMTLREATEVLALRASEVPE